MGPSAFGKLKLGLKPLYEICPFLSLRFRGLGDLFCARWKICSQNGFLSGFSGVSSGSTCTSGTSANSPYGRLVSNRRFPSPSLFLGGRCEVVQCAKPSRDVLLLYSGAVVSAKEKVWSVRKKDKVQSQNEVNLL